LVGPSWLVGAGGNQLIRFLTLCYVWVCLQVKLNTGVDYRGLLGWGWLVERKKIAV
jgi:hypothetical protein